MNLLETFDSLVDAWREVFTQDRTYQRARRLAFSLMVCLRQHLISNAICATGRQYEDWSTDYRVFSRSPWDPPRLFDPIFHHLPSLLPTPDAPVLMALDDTLCKKSSPLIPGVSVGRDPMSPRFHVNLCYGIRFVQASILVTPQSGGAARALPVRFEFAPPVKKPRRLSKKKKSAAGTAASPATPAASGSSTPADEAEEEKKKKEEEEAQWTAYKEEKKLRRLPIVGLKVVCSVRESLDQQPETRERTLISCVDNSYTTRDMIRGLPKRTVLIGRIRKNARLCYPLTATTPKTRGRQKYGDPAPTPEQILSDDAVTFTTVRCFAAGQWRDIPVKVLRPLYWRKAGYDIPVQLVVIKPLGYRLRQGGKLLYRQPAYLICTDPNLDLQALVQAYIQRWEIECNHRDEKFLLGVAQGQVWNPLSVARLPQFQVAGYSLLQLASLLSTGFQRSEVHLPLPKWRRPSNRPSLLDMLNLLRTQIFAYGFDALVPPARQNSSKLPLTAESLATDAA